MKETGAMKETGKILQSQIISAELWRERKKQQPYVRSCNYFAKEKLV